MGRHYSSEDTLKQAIHTLDALKKHGEVVRSSGFAARDEARLVELRDMLGAAGVGRAEAIVENVANSKEYQEALRIGRIARLQARPVLEGAKEDLSESEEAGDVAAANSLSATLAQTRVAGADATSLAEQLTLLRSALQQEAVVALSADRQGEQIVEGLGDAIEKLTKAARGRVLRPGTPEHTEHLDLLDGLIIKLVRRARKVARAASRIKGQPSIVESFKLDRLYGK